MVRVVVKTYIAEVVDTEIRGSAMVITVLMMQIGSILVVSLGLPLTWYQVPFINTGIFVTYCLVIVPLLPESPTFLAVTNNDVEAKAVLRRLKGPTVDVNEVLLDLKIRNKSVKTQSVGDSC